MQSDIEMTEGYVKADLARFAPLALDGISIAARAADDLVPYLSPIEALIRRHQTRYEPDERLIEYARDFTSTHLDVARHIGNSLEDGSLKIAEHYLKPWLDLDPTVFTAPRRIIYVPDAPNSTADPAVRYKLEWTDQLPELNFFDPIAQASRWRYQVASASKVEGKCFVRSSTNGAETDVQAGVGVLFQPARSRGFFQFRALVLWSPWVSISADAPPVAPPHPFATSQSYGAVRLIAQSWRASDAGDFRTDAIRTIELWNHSVFTPNRLWGWNEGGIANPGNEGWIELPVNRDRVYALWVILRCWSKSTYSPPSLSSALGMGSCLIPFMIVEG